jgi:hypothetical protein
VGQPAAEHLGVAASRNPICVPRPQTERQSVARTRLKCAALARLLRGRKPKSQKGNGGNRPEREPYLSGLLLARPRPSAEDGPNDFLWDWRDARGGHEGRNPVGLALSGSAPS